MPLSIALAFLSTTEISILATVVVALAGFHFNDRNAKRDREARAAQAAQEHEHAERLARSERTYRTRSEAYAEAARVLRMEGLVVWRADAFAYPEGTPHPDLKDPIGEVEWARIMGKVGVHSSREALEALENVRERMNSFTLAMTVLRTTQDIAAREQEELDSGRVDRPDYNPWRTPGLVKAQEDVEECRQDAYEAIDAAEAIMREELLAV
jgi:hypothetical protein